MNQETKDIIEKIIDENSLLETINAISEICYLKEDHVRSNWQDENLAKEWSKCGKEISKIADKDCIIYLP